MPTVAHTRPLDRARTAQLFHALSDETRLAVLDMLRDGERCVCELQDALDAAQSRLSFHLKVLKDAGLVYDRKEGRWSYYSLATDALDTAQRALQKLATPGHSGRSLRVFASCCG
jgi:ArsR family transcriptional regulator